MGIGSPIIGWIADFIKSIYKVIVFAGITTCMLFILLFYFDHMNMASLMILMLFLGICCSYQVLVFNIAGLVVDKSFSGLTAGIVNGINMGFGSLIHYILGKTIQISWDGTLNAKGAPLYSKAAFKQSFSY